MIGVSPDPVKRVKRFHEKQSLDFTLLADEDHAVSEAYGVWLEKSMYGKTFWGVQRATFIIDEDGTVARVFPKVSPKTHDELVLGALARAGRLGDPGLPGPASPQRPRSRGQLESRLRTAQAPPASPLSARSAWRDPGRRSTPPWAPRPR